MLCQQCQQRDAAVRLTHVRQSCITRMRLCEQCAKETDPTLAFPVPCERCQQQEAVFHLTNFGQVRVVKSILCETCEVETGLVELGSGGWLDQLWTTGRASALLSAYIKTCQVQFRHPAAAYELVSDSITAANQAKTACGGMEGVVHVSAGELLVAFREQVIRRYGKQARAHLAELRILRTEDIGEIVFEMVEARLLGIKKEDKPEDFANGYDFSEAFPED